jgi:3-vinyl bacteriochlorophyllide hydratase
VTTKPMRQHQIMKAPYQIGGIAPVRSARARAPLYTPAQRIRRDESRWTLVQGILAPVQFLVFLVRTLVLYAIMITGSIWEKVVFDKWLFAKAFFWEDVFSMLVLALHTAYLVAYYRGLGSEADRMLLALAAYATYLINAGQFLWKLRMARLDAERTA